MLRYPYEAYFQDNKQHAWSQKAEIYWVTDRYGVRADREKESLGCSTAHVCVAPPGLGTRVSLNANSKRRLRVPDEATTRLFKVSMNEAGVR